VGLFHRPLSPIEFGRRRRKLILAGEAAGRERQSSMRNFAIVETLGTLKACLALLPSMFAPVMSRVVPSIYLSTGSGADSATDSGCPILYCHLPRMFSYVQPRFAIPALWPFYW
jgi:hypothetical protein